ncbi:aminotransferase class V-fold PLP-dependent enzyme [Stappia sp.]|uniref:aminotransferase class V-fold PLP-dependent enzyme n=1 Tax=Stappia sp. TaxID=1870903 RepID=UPI003C7D95B2
MRRLADFARDLQADGETLARLRQDVIGEGVCFDGPFGTRRLVYADYTASGRALGCVERFIAESVLPFYANSHTEASFCGSAMTRLRAEARATIARLLNAGPDASVIFAGSGATAGVTRLVSLLGLDHRAGDDHPGLRPLVIIGPYEHHSNILPWREAAADVIAVNEAPSGGPDLEELEEILRRNAERPLIVGAFSAASNVTGIVTDVVAVTRILKRHGALAVWDYAGGGPYLPVDMRPAPGVALDAVFLSPHKFAGGPAASGVLAVRGDAVRRKIPTAPGGGTVTFVSPWGHDYSASLAAREEAGTPDVIGDIRAALVFLVKEAIGQETIAARDGVLCERAFAAWSAVPEIDLLAGDKRARLPIFSFRVRDGAGGFIHQQLVTRMLSDHYGIQARGGCACAGPYGHQLLEIDAAASSVLRAAILTGEEIEKPGWCRLNLSYLMEDATVGFVLDSVADLARRAPSLVPLYACDRTTARFSAAG